MWSRIGINGAQDITNKKLCFSIIISSKQVNHSNFAMIMCVCYLLPLIISHSRPQIHTAGKQISMPIDIMWKSCVHLTIMDFGNSSKMIYEEGRATTLQLSIVYMWLI